MAKKKRDINFLKLIKEKNVVVLIIEASQLFFCQIFFRQFSSIWVHKYEKRSTGLHNSLLYVFLSWEKWKFSTVFEDFSWRCQTWPWKTPSEKLCRICFFSRLNNKFSVCFISWDFEIFYVRWLFSCVSHSHSFELKFRNILIRFPATENLQRFFD